MPPQYPVLGSEPHGKKGHELTINTRHVMLEETNYIPFHLKKLELDELAEVRKEEAGFGISVKE